MENDSAALIDTSSAGFVNIEEANLAIAVPAYVPAHNSADHNVSHADCKSSLATYYFENLIADRHMYIENKTMFVT